MSLYEPEGKLNRTWLIDKINSSLNLKAKLLEIEDPNYSPGGAFIIIGLQIQDIDQIDICQIIETNNNFEVIVRKDNKENGVACDTLSSIKSAIKAHLDTKRNSGYANITNKKLDEVIQTAKTESYPKIVIEILQELRRRREK